jgi:thymidylate synthase
LSFEPIYYADRLRIINPNGDVGIVTLWSDPDKALAKIGGAAPELADATRSRIAVVGNLYGNGMYAMFCNLLYNPQVRHLIAIGQDLKLPTVDEIRAFLDHGLEDVEFAGRSLKQVVGTQRVFPADNAFDTLRLREQLTFTALGTLSATDAIERLRACIAALPAGEPTGLPRVKVEAEPDLDGSDTYQPSDVMAHQVVRARPLECWKELVVRTVRFGRPVTLGDGRRRELLDVKTVITDPVEEPADDLAAYGFSLARFEAYQREILDPVLPDDITYTYGNRLRGFFKVDGYGCDALEGAIDLLHAAPNTRAAYLSLWDTSSDLLSRSSPPCLTTLWFRRSDDRLTLTATYRAHNLLRAWLENVYGLIAIQRYVGERVGMPPGPITVLSHSLGIDPSDPRYAIAQGIADAWTNDDDYDAETQRYHLRLDPNGYFVVSHDNEAGTIIAEHRAEGILLKRYESPRADEIARAVAADMAVTVSSHAIWLGRELERHERLAQVGR